MASIWTVTAEDERVDLEYVDSEGGTHPFWVRLKKRLSVGEARKVQTAGWRGVSGIGQASPEIAVNWERQTFARVQAYLTDWSLKDDNQNKLPLTLDVIETLHEDVFALIDEAVSRHVRTMEAEKNARAGGTGPSATSD